MLCDERQQQMLGIVGVMKNSVHLDGFCRGFDQKNKLGRNYPVPCYPSVYRIVNRFYRDLEVGVDVSFHS